MPIKAFCRDFGVIHMLGKNLISIILLAAAVCTPACTEKDDSNGDKPTGSATLRIDSPISPAVVTSRGITVNGSVDQARPDSTVILGDQTILLVGTTFEFTDVPVNPGPNTLTVILKDAAGRMLDSQDVSVNFVPPSEASAIVGAAGGSVAVSSGIINGARLDIPAGALGREINFRLSFIAVSDQSSISTLGSDTDSEEVVADIPAGRRSMGVALSVQPIGVTFARPVNVVVPISESRLPAGVGLDSVRIFIQRNGELEEIPATETPGGMAVSLEDTLWEYLIPVVPEPVGANTLRIVTDPPSAALLVDGVEWDEITPAKVTGLEENVDHEVRAYLPGYDESIFSVNLVGGIGTERQIKLVPRAVPAVLVEFDDPASSGSVTTSEALFSLRGTVSIDGVAQPGARGTLRVNDRVSVFSSNSVGRFEAVVLLDNGANKFQCHITSVSGKTAECPDLEVTYDSASSAAVMRTRAGVAKSNVASAATASESGIRVRLSWNTQETDVDLEVTDPDGNLASYRNLLGIPGGSLDRDDTDGIGPEVFTMPNPRPGRYIVGVRYFSDGGVGPSTAVVQSTLNGTSVFSGSRLLGATGAYWNAHFIDVGELIISKALSVSGQKKIFTTRPDERDIMVDVQAPENILDSQIRFMIREVNEDGDFRNVVALPVAPRRFAIALDHKRLLSLVDPRNSKRLKFEIRAMGGSGSTVLESNVATLEQDDLSQIRQEYVDKSDVEARFSIAPPLRELVKTAATYVPPSGLSFSDLARGSDFPAYAFIDRSDDIFSSVRAKWGLPIRVTSGWRNPRKNDSLRGSAINSAHQTGSAIDLNPIPGSGYPEQIKLLDQTVQQTAAQIALAKAACQSLSAEHFVLVHLDHVHIEYKAAGGNAGLSTCPKIE